MTRPLVMITLLCAILFSAGFEVSAQRAPKGDPLASLPDVLCIQDTESPRFAAQFQPRGSSPAEPAVPFILFYDEDAVDAVRLEVKNIKITLDHLGNTIITLLGERTVVNPALERPPVRVQASFKFRGRDFSSGKGAGVWDVIADAEPPAERDAPFNFIRARRDISIRGRAYSDPLGCQNSAQAGR